MRTGQNPCLRRHGAGKHTDKGYIFLNSILRLATGEKLARAHVNGLISRSYCKLVGPGEVTTRAFIPQVLFR